MAKGDRLLSATDLTLWSLVNEVLLRWKVLVLFKWQMLNVPEGKAGYVHFMVPEDTPSKDQIVEFLRKEIKQFSEEPNMSPIGNELHTTPGQTVRVDVAVEEFKGLAPYLENEHLNRETAQKLQEFRNMWRRPGS